VIPEFELTVVRGTLMFPGADYENVFGPAPAVALLRLGTDLLILPIHQAVFGGHLARLRNAPSRNDPEAAPPDVRNAHSWDDPGPRPEEPGVAPADVRNAGGDRVADCVIDALEFFRQQQLDSEDELRVCAYWNPERSALCVRGLFACRA
jgi:hypothetical protein